MSLIKSVSTTQHMEDLRKKYKISPSEAYRVGLSVILSEVGEQQFINITNVGRKIQRMAELVNKQAQKLEEYQSVLEEKK